MKAQELQIKDLESIGFSMPTAARLKSLGINTVHDLIIREESITISLIEKTNSSALPEPELMLGRPVTTLPVSSHTRNSLTNSSIDSVPKLLSKKAGEIMCCHAFGWKSLAQLLVCLVNEGYSEKDGILLSKEGSYKYLVRTEMYAELLRLENAHQLPLSFKRWFNKMIEGYEISVKRTNRKIFIEPFKITK
ncbi:MAG: hypothetical protein RIT04_404 [Candidatus Parcubacteria bacterium]